MDLSTSSTVASWAAFTCVTGALVCYYSGGTKYVGKFFKGAPATLGGQSQSSSNKKRQKDQSGKRKEVTARSTPLVKDKPEAATTSAAQASSSNSTNKKRKAGKNPSNPEPAAPAATSADVDKVDELDDDDRDWARQLAATQAGVTLERSSGKTALKKKGKEQAELAAPPSATSSYPPPTSLSNGGAHVSGDVSDMLEAKAAGPTSIRITGEEQKKKQKTPKAPEVKETKKQRQNRRKVEEKAAQREADEKHRQTLLENQRRSAREARGEPAKNGLGSAAAPSNNAWSSGALDGANAVASPPAVQTNSTQLLDTFDQDAASVGSSNDSPATNSTTPATAASTDGDLPTEEAQLQMLAEMSGWSEVGVGGKKKKAKGKMTPNSPPSEAGSRVSNVGGLSTSDLVNGTSRASTPISKQPPITKPAVTSQPKTNGQTASAPQKQKTPSLMPAPAPVKGHPEDSEWAP